MMFSRNAVVAFAGLTILLAAVVALSSVRPAATADAAGSEISDADHAALMVRFDYLSANGNSNCSGAFLDAIVAMQPFMAINGSCCSPMNAHRYVEQVVALREYESISAIPRDPYSIPAGLAQRLMPYYALELSSAEQAAWDYAMANSNEGGPCCCRCWRWVVYGGLAKLLIRDHGFTGDEIATIWDLSDGCGGAGDHVHL
jgi:hypothetical protein